MADDAVSRKISKLVDEGMPQDQAVAVASDMKRRGKLKSPAPDVQGFTETPDPASSAGLPRSYTQTPDRSDPETAARLGSLNQPSARGRPSGVQELGSGAEQRGVTTSTRQSDVKPMGGSMGDDLPEGVQRFDQGADV